MHKNVSFILRKAMRSHPLKIAILSILRLVAIPTNMTIIPWLLKDLVNNISGSKSFSSCKIYIFYFSGVFLIRSVLDFLASLLGGYVKINLEQDIRSIIFSKIQSISFEEFSQISSSKISDLLDKSASKLVKSFEIVINKFLPGICFTLINWFLMYQISKMLTIISISWMLTHMFFVLVINRLTKKHYATAATIRNQNQQMINNIFRNKIVEYFFGLESINFDYFNYLGSKERKITQRVSFVNSVLLLIKDLNTLLIQGILFNSYLIFMVVKGVINEGELVFIFQTNRSFLMFFSHISEHISEFIEEQSKSNIIKEIISLPPRSQQKGEMCLIEKAKLLKIENLTITRNKKLLINNFSFDFPLGSKVAILGPSGAGKTTFLYILAGLIDSYIGNIFVDGVNFRFLNQQEFTSLSFASVELFFDNLSIDENIIMFRNCEQKQLTEIKKMLLIDHLDSSKLNINLSTGEKQRVILARSLINCKSKSIFLFDESLSYIDAPNKEQILSSILKLLSEQTIFFVDHTNCFVNKSEWVIFFGRNNNISIDHHASLMLTNLEYRQFYESKIR